MKHSYVAQRWLRRVVSQYPRLIRLCKGRKRLHDEESKYYNDCVVCDAWYVSIDVSYTVLIAHRFK
jgi:hypothetical protein